MNEADSLYWLYKTELNTLRNDCVLCLLSVAVRARACVSTPGRAAKMLIAANKRLQ